MNTAQRIYDLLLEAAKSADGDTTLNVWSKVFGLTDQGQHKKVAEISLRLSMLHGEVELLSAKMASTDVPEEVYGPPLRKVEAAISTHSLSAKWITYKQNLSPEVMLALRYNAALLGSQELPISDDEITSLLQEVADLEASLNDSGLSQEVLNLIEKQLNSIRQALGEYKIKGASAIKDAVHKAAGELIEHKELITPNNESEVVGRLGQLWYRFTQMGDAVVKADKVLESGQRVWGLIESVFKSSAGGG